MLGMDELLAFNVEETAEWRHRMALEHPDDAERNLAAADLLTRLAQELRALEGSALHQRAAALLSTDIDTTAASSTIISEATRAVGFRSIPGSGEEFLEELIRDFENELARDRSSSVLLSSQAEHPSV